MARPKKEQEHLRNRKGFYYLTKDEEESFKEALNEVNEDKSEFVRKAIAERIERLKKQKKKGES